MQGKRSATLASKDTMLEKRDKKEDEYNSRKLDTMKILNSMAGKDSVYMHIQQ